MDLAENVASNTMECKKLSRDRLIIKYLPYVKRIAYRINAHIPSNSVDVDDLISAGIIGLIQAAESYDSTRNVQFITYAAFRIKGAVLSELRSQDFLSRSIRRKIRNLNNAYESLEQKLCREVDDEEVANELGINLEELYNIKKIASLSFISFEEIGLVSHKDKEQLVKGVINNNNDVLNLMKLKEISSATSEAINQLNEKEKLVISLYYEDELTMKEIGKILDLTESRVSQLHSSAIYCLRRKLKRMGMIDN